MRDAAGELADRFHLLRLAELLLGAPKGVGCFLLGGHVPAKRIDEAVLAGRGPGEPAIRPVLVAVAILEPDRAATLDQLPALGERYGGIVGMPQRRDRHAQQFRLGPAQDRTRCRIDAYPMIREVGDADEILRYAPEPVALACALCDLLLQRFVQPVQRFLGTLAFRYVDVGADKAQGLAVGVALDL